MEKVTKELKQNSIINHSPTTKGESTTVTYKILRDNNLSSNDKILLIELLSNNNNHSLNYEVLIKRTGIKEKSIRNSMNNLESNKYLKRIKKPRGWFYIVCGNGEVDDVKHIIINNEIQLLEDDKVKSDTSTQKVKETPVEVSISTKEDLAEVEPETIPTEIDMELKRKLELIEGILSFDIKIDNTDYIDIDSLEEIKRLSSLYTQTKLMSFFKSIDLGKGKFTKITIENKCNCCEEITIHQVSKGNIAEYIRGNITCNSCESKKQKIKNLKDMDMVKERNKKIEDYNKFYLEFNLNPNKQFNIDKPYKERWELINNHYLDKEIVYNTVRLLPYKEFLKTPYWKTISQRAKYKAGYQCKLCSSNKKLETHHPNYDILGKELQNMDKLVVLCHNCHDKFHN